MPDPAANFQLMKADLEAAGFTVDHRSRRRGTPTTSPQVNAGKAQLYLLGWTGDFGDPDNFVGTFFQTKQPPWGFDNPEIFTLLEEARGRARPGQADGALPGGQQARSWTSCRAAVRAHPAGARVQGRASRASCRAR